jgi:hypothetical protein
VHFDRLLLQEFCEKLMAALLSDCASCNMVDIVTIIKWPTFCNQYCWEKINSVMNDCCT